MKEYLYVMLMENRKPLDVEIIQKHVEHLKMLEEKGILLICGPFTDDGGGMVIMKTATIQDAHDIARSDPFIKYGYKSYEIRTLEWAKKDNGFGLDS